MQVSSLDETFLIYKNFRHVSHKFGSAEFASLVFRRDFFINKKLPHQLQPMG